MAKEPQVTNQVVKWLESPEGENWSRNTHDDVPRILVGIKDDVHDICDDPGYCCHINAYLPVFTQY